MGIIENAKEVADLIKKIGDQDLYRRIVDLQGEVVDLTGKVVTLSQQFLEVKQKNAELEGLLNVKGAMERHGFFYFLPNDPHGHCARCWEVEKKVVHIASIRHEKNGVQWTCPQCKTAYYGSPKREHNTQSPQ